MFCDSAVQQAWYVMDSMLFTLTPSVDLTGAGLIENMAGKALLQTMVVYTTYGPTGTRLTLIRCTAWWLEGNKSLISSSNTHKF